MKRSGVKMVGALSLLYAAQGIPFGFAAEYLPVVLREAHFSMAQIALLGWLQLPWHLKVLWATIADRPYFRARSRSILLALQALLAASVAAYAAFTLADAPFAWFALTVLAAFFAATQDVFVDAIAVRVLTAGERGLGNVAQVAGYRVGILAGGSGLLLLVGSVGERTTVLLCAGAIGVASVGAFALRGDDGAEPTSEDAKHARAPLTVREVVARLVAKDAWPVLATALTFKLGLHMATGILKPVLVDAGWTKAQIGATFFLGLICSLLGAAAGGWVHRTTREPRALAWSVVVQTATCMPLVAASRLGSPHALTTFAIAVEHFASGLGTTVLFAALMSATRKSNAGLHYTILTSANAVAIGVGGLLGGLLADALGKTIVFAVAAVVTFAPITLVPRWARAAEASSQKACPNKP